MNIYEKFELTKYLVEAQGHLEAARRCLAQAKVRVPEQEVGLRHSVTRLFNQLYADNFEFGANGGDCKAWDIKHIIVNQVCAAKQNSSRL